MGDPRSCNDCGAPVGEPHSPGCDVARCLVTGGQRISCEGGDGLGHAVEVMPGCFEVRDCGHQVWSGAWPGVAECEELGWHSYLVPYEGWTRCEPDHPEAGTDLNRLFAEAEWDRAACRWRRPGGPVDDTVYVAWHLARGYALEPSARYAVDGVTLPAAGLLARITEDPSRVSHAACLACSDLDEGPCLCRTECGHLNCTGRWRGEPNPVEPPASPPYA